MDGCTIINPRLYNQHSKEHPNNLKSQIRPSIITNGLLLLWMLTVAESLHLTADIAKLKSITLHGYTIAAAEYPRELLTR